ncbi:serine/threonine dehydratase [Rhizobium sp. J15]|uniref:threonine ammonia-lyase n=1 Tax=Rhizobium sp. J15 TaxID=2035450 RepID=UPI000BE793D0|nr:threonine/serine dehydratase [Rhizobium sp. J15]PDT08865.1 serine/threonine dehydratase [Rhizobium sp. J15]
MYDFGNLRDDIAAAAERIREFVVRTPLLESVTLNDELGVRLIVKPENLQKTGSFKARGALNFLLRHGASAGSSFVGYSSGNHAQGLAYAARICGSAATVLMPKTASPRKIERTRALGATVELLDDFFETRQLRVNDLVSQGFVFVPPFDHDDIIAGQGTVGLEIAEQLNARSITPDFIAIPASGGGLIAGSGVAVKADFPECAIVAVEPRGFDDFARSIAAGELQDFEPGESTLCDGLMSPRPGLLPFKIVRGLRPSFETVSDIDVTNAIRTLFDNFNLIAEPSGAAAFASILAKSSAFRGKTVVVVVSGGNVGSALFTSALEGATAGNPTFRRKTIQ